MQTVQSFLHHTAILNTFEEDSHILIDGEGDIELYGIMVAGGVIGEDGVDYSNGADSTITVRGLEHILVDTGLQAAQAITLETSEAGGEDDNGIGVLITSSGGLTAAGVSNSNQGGDITSGCGGGVFEITGNIYAGVTRTIELDPSLPLPISEDFDWSRAENSEVQIQSADRVNIGGTTLNKEGEEITTGGYVRSGERIDLIGFANSSDIGVWVQGASEITTELAVPESVINIEGTGDVEIEGSLVAGGEFEEFVTPIPVLLWVVRSTSMLPMEMEINQAPRS